MPDYQQGKIYTIRCKTDDTLIYVGSTTQSLAVRLGGHKASSNIEKQKNRLIYRTINSDWENWYIELYELYPCNSKEELCKREGEIIRLLGNLNSSIEGRTHKEYYLTKQESILKQKKEYYIINRDKILEGKKAYYNANKIIISIKSKARYIIKKHTNNYNKLKNEIEATTCASYCCSGMPEQPQLI